MDEPLTREEWCTEIARLLNEEHDAPKTTNMAALRPRGKPIGKVALSPFDMMDIINDVGRKISDL